MIVKNWYTGKEIGEFNVLPLATLSGTDLHGATLSGADLSGTDLRGAYLSGANLHGAIYDHTTIGINLVCPEVGSFDGFKKCKSGVIVKVRIPTNARRSSATGRKCRAEFVKVLAVYGANEGISDHDSSVVYRVGEIVKAHMWDENRWSECSGGIHFFLTRHEAETYNS